MTRRKIVKTASAYWTRADLNHYASCLTLILAVVHTVLVIAGTAQGKDIDDNALWMLGLTACSLGFRALARLDEMRAEHADRIAALEILIDAAERRQ